MKKKEPVRLHKKPEKQRIKINPLLIGIIIFIIISIIAILLAIACTSPYNMSWA